MDGSEKVNVLDDEEMIRIYRQQRHDFLNYIQIILGYLQIDQKDRAIDYIHKIIDEINEERSIFLLNTQSIIRLLKLKYELKRRGINLSIKIDDIVEDIDVDAVSIKAIEDYSPDVQLHIKQGKNGIEYILSKKEGD